jgi:hypothetical protein
MVKLTHNLTEVPLTVDTLYEDFQVIYGKLDILWLLFGAYLVFFMQVRFNSVCAQRAVVQFFLSVNSVSVNLVPLRNFTDVE